MYVFNDIARKLRFRSRGFTLVEVAAALLILSLLIGSTMVLMNRYLGAVMDLRLREHAFNLARSNMETLLTETRVSEKSEYGTSEQNPDIEWQTVVEPFYEPMTDRMWVRAICSAGYMDSQGKRQDVELEHWLTGLSASQVKQIVAQQEIEVEYLELLDGENITEIQEITRAYLEEKELDVNAYDRFIERQRREKIEHLSEEGMDGYDKLMEELKEEENVFLDELGMDFDEYNDFAMVYVPKNKPNESLPSGVGMGSGLNTGASSGFGNEGQTNNSNASEDSFDIDWDQIPREFWDIFKMLGLNPPE